MVYVGILAAGVGERMHRQDIPKQFLPLGEKPILVHTLEQFFANARVDKIIVVAPDNWKLYTEDLLSGHNTMGKECVVITGGANKTVSIFKVIKHIDQTWGIAGDDVLVAHDAIRPFVTQRIINDNIDAAQKYGAANTAVVTNDTILVSRDGQTLSEIPPHHLMRAEQTPQTYMLEKLKSAVEQAVAEGITLESESELPRLYIQYGGPMRLVRGEYSNIKIINPYDLEVANALLEERKTW